MSAETQQRIDDLAAQLALAATTIEAPKATQPALIRAAEDAAYETAAARLKNYALRTLSGMAYGSMVVVAILVRSSRTRSSRKRDKGVFDESRHNSNPFWIHV